MGIGHSPGECSPLRFPHTQGPPDEGLPPPPIKTQLCHCHTFICYQTFSFAYLDFAMGKRASSLVLAYFPFFVFGRLLFVLFLSTSLCLCNAAHSGSKLTSSLSISYGSLHFSVEQTLFWKKGGRGGGGGAFMKDLEKKRNSSRRCKQTKIKVKQCILKVSPFLH